MAWYDSNWLYRIKITVDNTKVDADLTDFPVYVDLSDLGTDFHTNVKSDGGDIRITKSDGTTEVAREIVAIATGSETGEMHFQADGTLSSSTDTDYYIYYGNSGASEPASSATYGSENTWDANYLVVYHLQEDPSGTAPQMVDSTSNSNDGTSAGSMTSGDSVAGKLAGGNALDFDGSDDDIRSGSNLGITGTGSRTISCWVNLNSTPADADPIVSMGTTNYFNLVTGLGGDGNWGIRTGTSAPPANDLPSSSSSSSDIGTYVYLAGTYDGTTSRLRRNGSQIATGSRTLSTSDSIFRVAEGSQTTRNPPAKIDEARISNVRRSDSWLITEYNNQNSPSTFYTVGAQESEVTFTPRIVMVL